MVQSTRFTEQYSLPATRVHCLSQSYVVNHFLPLLYIPGTDSILQFINILFSGHRSLFVLVGGCRSVGWSFCLDLVRQPSCIYICLGNVGLYMAMLADVSVAIGNVHLRPQSLCLVHNALHCIHALLKLLYQ